MTSEPPEVIVDTPSPDEAEAPEIDVLTITLGVLDWKGRQGWTDSGEIYYEAEIWSLATSRDYVRALAEELGINAAQRNGFTVDVHDRGGGVGASGLEVVDVLVLAVQAAGSIALEHAFLRVVDKLRRLTYPEPVDLSEDAVIDRARRRIATRYDTQYDALRVARITDGPGAVEVELAEATGRTRYVVEFGRARPTTKITRVSRSD